MKALTVRLEDEFYKKIMKMCIDKDTNFQKLVTNLLKEELKENNKMENKYKNKKFLTIKCSTLTERKSNSDNWYYRGDTTERFENLFDTIEEANKYYNSIELNDEIQEYNRYSDYKQLFAVNNDITEEDIIDLDLDEAELIKDDYTFLNYL